jgi:RNA polymerase sigma factor (sigma-70 family)
MDASQSLERAYRDEATRIRAALAARTGDVGLAEDAVQDAFIEAIEHWPRAGVPPNPGGWLATTARRKAVDRLRRDKAGAEKLALLAAGDAVACRDGLDGPDGDAGRQADDELLSLVFACCHPALPEQSQVALTLRAVCGLTSDQIASAFLVGEPAMAQRLLRARKALQQAGAEVRVPDPDELGGRLAGVLAVVYLVFNEGYLASSGREPARRDLAAQAIALTRTLHRLMPREPEVLGLLALLLLHESRAAARFDGWGRLIRLQDQDRGRWDRDLAKEASALLDRAIALRRPGPYQVQAAIAALHAEAPCYEQTDWRQIRLLYDRLQRMAPSPVVLLNRAVATRYAVGAEAALAEIGPLSAELDGYHLFHALRAGLLTTLGRPDEAARASERALALAVNPAERELLTRGLSLLARGDDPRSPPAAFGDIVLVVASKAHRHLASREPDSAHFQDRAQLDRDPSPVHPRPAPGDLDRLVHRVGVDDRVTAEHLLGLDERPVGDAGRPDRLGRLRTLELVAAVQLAGRAPLLVPGADLGEPGVVLGAPRSRLGGGVHDQHDVLHSRLLVLAVPASGAPSHRTPRMAGTGSDTS